MKVILGSSEEKESKEGSIGVVLRLGCIFFLTFVVSVKLFGLKITFSDDGYPCFLC